MLVLVACTAAKPGWTYAPAPSQRRSRAWCRAVGGPERVASHRFGLGFGVGSASAGAGEVVEIEAVQIAFNPTQATAPADTPFQILLRNQDQDIPHNVEIKDAGGASVFKGEIFNGVDERTYDVPALPAADYQFVCTVHPNMTGTLTAE